MRPNSFSPRLLRHLAVLLALTALPLLLGSSCQTFEGKPTPPPALPRPTTADPKQVANTVILALTVSSPVSNASRRWRLALAADSAASDRRLTPFLEALEPRLRREPQIFYYGAAAGQKLDYQLRLRIADPAPAPVPVTTPAAPLPATPPGPTLLTELLSPDGATVVWTYRSEL